MSVNLHNYEIEQGEDTEISLVYKTKENPDAPAVAVDLTDYSVRLDIAVQGTGTRIWTFNSSDDAGASPIDETGSEDNEAVLNEDGEIHIVVPRALSLEGGAIFEELGTGRLVFDYDLFLRNPEGKQKKILKGVFTVNKSVTLWT